MDLFINILLRQFKIATNVIASEKCFLNNENTRSIKKVAPPKYGFGFRYILSVNLVCKVILALDLAAKSNTFVAFAIAFFGRNYLRKMPMPTLSTLRSREIRKNKDSA